MPIKSRWVDQFTELPNQSKFHNKIREFFTNDLLLRGLNAYQEVPVRDLVEDYPDNHYFDWYVDQLLTVIELHGAQHYKPVAFGAKSYESKMRGFKQMQQRDSQKKAAALKANYSYLEISYKQYQNLDARSFKALLFGVGK